jgi:AcrR family transcriptional regulator
MSATEVDAEPGLRERKRLATRRAIQRATLTLSTENGFDRVTVDEISNVAQVSPRTFFNYFPSKEAAVIGDVPALPDDASVEAFINAGPDQAILDGIRDLLASAVDDNDEAEEPDVHQMRRALLKDNPQLFTLRMAGMKQLETDLTDVVRRRLAVDDPELANESVDALEQRARLITLVAFAGIRHAWWCWADAGGKGPLSERLRDSFAELQRLGRAGL